KRVIEAYRRNQIDNAKSLEILLQAQYGEGHYTGDADKVSEEHEKYRLDGSVSGHRDYAGELNKIIKELIIIAQELIAADKAGDEIGLTKEELSFYHAITFTGTIKNLYEDDVLIKMAQELAKELKANESIDWQSKKSGRARMRTIVRRLLRKYDYPPKEMQGALGIVLKQCEHWTVRRAR
ncbi:MAG: DUF3387 domain-containing protein, partial [Firmicutes bacterium]|nr:DUF3387 domain-containing protein [Bacillota bacterium]